MKTPMREHLEFAILFCIMILPCIACMVLITKTAINYSFTKQTRNMKATTVATMIKILLIAGTIAFISMNVGAQRIIKDANGNYHYAKDSASTKVKVKDPATGTYTDKDGVKHQLYTGSKGGVYYTYTDSSNKEKKRYMPKG